MTAMPSTATNSHDNAQGFTLIELLVVLAIVGLLAGLAVSAFGRADPLRSRRDRAEITRLTSEARMRALLTGRPVEIKAQDVPTGIRIVSSAGPILRWYPDGSAMPARVLRGETLLLSIDGNTGFAVQTP